METRQLEIKTFIVENFMFGSGGESLTLEASLLDQGVIDSTGVLELVEFLEHTYGIAVDDDELIPDNLDSLQSIDAYVARKQRGLETHAADTVGVD